MPGVKTLKFFPSHDMRSPSVAFVTVNYVRGDSYNKLADVGCASLQLHMKACFQCPSPYQLFQKYTIIYVLRVNSKSRKNKNERESEQVSL